jgi:hypothetical protein
MEKLKGGMRSKGRKDHKQLYKVWSTMKERCSNPNSISYPRYGAKGIKVCERWFSFDNFFEDFGHLYQEGLCIDRIDNKKGYCPENCRWVTNRENCNNTSVNVFVEYEGKTDTLSNICREHCLNYKRVHQNMKRTGSFDKAIEIERRHHVSKC